MPEEIPVIRQIIFVKAPTTIVDVIPYILLFLVYGLIVQAVFGLWRRFHSRSYDIFVLVAIIACHPAVSLFLGSYAPLPLYVLFLAFMAYLVYTALNFSQKRNSTKLIFRAFSLIFLLTNHSSILLQAVLVLFFIFRVDRMLPVLKLMFYSIYYAVLSREIVRNICLVMARATGYYSKEGVPGRQQSSTSCMICTLPFTPEEKVFSLRCGHSYHEDCIKGWALVGQNSHCYYCKEPIDNRVFTQDYWIRTELYIKPMMNAMRSLIAFSTVVFGLLYVKFQMMQDGYEMD